MRRRLSGMTRRQRRLSRWMGWDLRKPEDRRQMRNVLRNCRAKMGRDFMAGMIVAKIRGPRFEKKLDRAMENARAQRGKYLIPHPSKKRPRVSKPTRVELMHLPRIRVDHRVDALQYSLGKAALSCS